ncbi:MAG: metallophosphoesterase family protein [Planctomycetes bacterium]|nr:metallophosphoesterase family protein [Planctomycetota bacterium]
MLSKGLHERGISKEHPGDLPGSRRCDRAPALNARCAPCTRARLGLDDVRCGRSTCARPRCSTFTCAPAFARPGDGRLALEPGDRPRRARGRACATPAGVVADRRRPRLAGAGASEEPEPRAAHLGRPRPSRRPGRSDTFLEAGEGLLMTQLTRRYAIISDLHSNVEAVTAVFDDIRSQQVDDIICLGDIVGYGPEPRPVLEMTMKLARVSLMGNHDEAVLKGAQNFNAWAREAIDWTREEIQVKDGKETDRWEYLKRMPLRFQTNGLYFVHGSPRQPTIEYILREDIYNGAYEKFDEIFASFEKVLFVGHSHTPCIINEDLEYVTPGEIEHNFTYTRDKRKVIVNVGSVGQPRDNDPRSCYVIIDNNTIRFRRIEYDVDAVVAKIKAVERLSDNLGLRLKKGV